MRILQLPQGYYKSLAGWTRDQAIARFTADGERFCAAHPQARPYYRPCWVELDVPDARTAPWGHEWYQVLDSGELQMHSAHYDSSG